MLLRSIKSMIQRDRRRYRRPRTLRDVIPVEHVWEDGIFQLGNKFSKSIRLKDVNYKAAGLDKRMQIIENYNALLDGIEPGVMVKLTVNNRSHSREALEKAVRMPMKNSGSDKYREEINGIIMDSFDKYEGRIKETYLTVSVFADDIQQAREDFKRIFDVIHAHLLELGSDDTPLDASERLGILRDFYRKGEEGEKIDFTGDGILPAEVLPQRMERKQDHLIIDGRYARVFYVKEIGNSLYEGLIHRLVSKKMDMMYSIDFMAVPKSEAGRFAERTVLGAETNLSNWQRRQNRSMNYTADIPYQMQKQRTAAKEFLHSIVSEDQTMFYTLMTLVLRADTKAQLDKDTKTLLSTGQDCGLEIALSADGRSECRASHGRAEDQRLSYPQYQQSRGVPALLDGGYYRSGRHVLRRQSGDRQPDPDRPEEAAESVRHLFWRTGLRQIRICEVCHLARDAQYQ